MREAGVRAWLYRPLRLLFEPLAYALLRPRLSGRSSIPESGPAIVVANHRSFLDPFLVAMLTRRPMYFVAKSEVFSLPLLDRLLPALGVMPVRRGAGDRQMLQSALAVLRRGDCLMIFAEGTRSSGPSLGKPMRGVGRLAVASGATVVPVAVAGTGAGERHPLRAHPTAAAAGRPRRYSRDCEPGVRPDQAATDDIWADVRARWERLTR